MRLFRGYHPLIPDGVPDKAADREAEINFGMEDIFDRSSETSYR